MRIFKKSITAIALTLLASYAFADITMVWNKTPLNISVPVGSVTHPEQLQLTFPEKVIFGMPADISGDLTVMNDNRTLYLSTDKAFSLHRNVMVKTKSGKTILINLSANKGASYAPIKIVYLQKSETVKSDDSDCPSQKVSMVELTRYAVQQLYAPQRLLHSVAGITEVNQFNGKSYNLISDGSLTAMPLYSWTGGGMVITAVLLKNNLNIPVNITPKMVCGQWVAFTPYPQSKVLARGSRYDTTTAFLISKNSFSTVYSTGCEA